MIAVVSPAKNLDFKTKHDVSTTHPRLLDCTNQLIDVMRSKSVDEVKDLMSISRQLAGLNVHRFKEYRPEHTPENSQPSVFAFNGDVYQGLQAETFDQGKLEFAQKHLRILSGLYGLLRPLDLIQPYRLEMGTKLVFDDYKTLYQYWDNTILDLLLEDLKAQGDDIIVNLASVEYFKSIDKKDIPARIIDVEFKDFKKDKYKIVSFYAKKARGLMSRYIIENGITSPEDLRGFDYKGYYFDESESSENKFSFKRDAKNNSVLKVLGIDVGGTGIKGAPVDTATGELLEKKFRIDTPRPATPEAFAQTIQTMVDQFGWDGPVGCGFPTVIVNGQTKTFSNLHESWLGINARDLFTKKTGCPFYVLNDAGAAGLAEMKFGAGKDKKGKVIIVTIGTGIGSAFFMNGQLIPNLELGRINSHKGKRIELYASRKTMEDKNLSLEEWAKRFDYFLNHVDDIVSPDHFIVGGGLSKKFEEFKGFLTVNVPIYAAEKRNIAGIVGAALAFELNQKELN